MPSTEVNGIEYRFFDHLYAVSRDGLVLKKLLPANPVLRKDGYVSVGRRRLLHRMVATCWVPRPEGSNHVHHRDHDKTNNRDSNLEWVTPKKHMAEYHPENGRHRMSEASKQKLRELRLGSKKSEATKQKHREVALRLGLKPPPRPVGTKCSPAAIEKMRRNSPHGVGCEVFGVVYPSFAEAGRALGERLHSLRKRCLSKNFPDYKMLV